MRKGYFRGRRGIVDHWKILGPTRYGVFHLLLGLMQQDGPDAGRVGTRHWISKQVEHFSRSTIYRVIDEICVGPNGEPNGNGLNYLAIDKAGVVWVLNPHGGDSKVQRSACGKSCGNSHSGTSQSGNSQSGTSQSGKEISQSGKNISQSGKSTGANSLNPKVDPDLIKGIRKGSRKGGATFVARWEENRIVIDRERLESELEEFCNAAGFDLANDFTQADLENIERDLTMSLLRHKHLRATEHSREPKRKQLDALVVGRFQDFIQRATNRADRRSSRGLGLDPDFYRGVDPEEQKRVRECTRDHGVDYMKGTRSRFCIDRCGWTERLPADDWDKYRVAIRVEGSSTP